MLMLLVAPDIFLPLDHGLVSSGSSSIRGIMPGSEKPAMKCNTEQLKYSQPRTMGMAGEIQDHIHVALLKAKHDRDQEKKQEKKSYSNKR